MRLTKSHTIYKIKQNKSQSKIDDLPEGVSLLLSSSPYKKVALQRTECPLSALQINLQALNRTP